MIVRWKRTKTRVNGQVNVGRDTPPRSKILGVGKRTLGVSLLGACTSKGCPTKSDENEDRYVHVRDK